MADYPEEPPIQDHRVPAGGPGARDGRRLRADALHNRHSLLAVAVSMLARSDEEVSLEAIAREAGVGIGTLYRHFPTREALVLDAYGDEIDQLCTAPGGLLGTLPPAVALREWMQWFVDYVTVKPGMGDALGTAVDAGGARLADAREQVVSALDTLLRAGREAGTVRPDMDAEDLLFALRGIWMVPRPSQPDRTRRLLNLLMDGLRVGAGGSGDPPSTPASGPGPTRVRSGRRA